MFFTKDHIWLKADTTGLTIGLTFYAQVHLGTLIYIDLPEVDRQIEAGETCMGFESKKKVQELSLPVNGIVVEVNKEALDTPTLVNDSPYEKGWLIKIKPAGDSVFNLSEQSDVMNDADYKIYLESL